jgi:hypothetical protein
MAAIAQEDAAKAVKAVKAGSALASSLSQAIEAHSFSQSIVEFGE